MITNFVLGFNFFIIFYVFIINFIYFIQLIFAIFNLYEYVEKIKYSDYKNYIVSDNMIPTSILVAAYNEENTIVNNVDSLLALKYPMFEVVVINDGSKDNTLEDLKRHFELEKINKPIHKRVETKKVRGIYESKKYSNLIVIDKENGGKADALNAGVNISSYPIVASIDADSILESDALVRVVMPFIKDKNTAAVGGIVRIANGSKIVDGRVVNVNIPKSKLARFQIIEYLRAFLIGRVGWDAINSVLIISGAFGVFRKDILVKVGGYAHTIGEDMELVLKIHKYSMDNKLNLRVKYIPDPVCWTQAPENLKGLRTQRRRWQVGLMQSLFSYKSMLFNPKYKQIGLFTLPYYWIFEMLGPLVETLGYILIPISYFIGLLNIKYLVLFFSASILYGIILSLGALLLEEYTFNKYPSIKQILILSIFAILENFGFRQLMTLYRTEGLFRYNSLKNKWGSIRRTKFN
ncbi:MAG: glycosyltransferase family 2 protein [Tissierellales bacterium]|nr:glycosyltransferase family 2 protein [Tissierellales bacterium]